MAAAVKSHTSAAPASNSRFAHSLPVVPVVMVSSTSKTRFPLHEAPLFIA